MKSTFDSQVIKEYYYIVNMVKLDEPKIMPIYFLNRFGAKAAIKKCISKKRQKYFKVVRGRDISDEYYRFQGKFQAFHISARKWWYPPGVETVEEKQAFRKKMGIRLKRMGFWTNVVPNKFYENKPSVVKRIFSKAKRATAHDSDAKVFQLQRKPPYYFYTILKKRYTFESGLLWKVKAMRYNRKTGEFKKVNINIKRNDFILPYLTGELIKIAENDKKGKEFADWARKKYPNYYKDAKVQILRPNV